MICPRCGRPTVAPGGRCERCGASIEDALATAVVASPPDLPRGPEDGDGVGPAVPGPGGVLGSRYRILREIGHGGMGIVLLANDRELDRVVALKVIRPELARRAAVVERFRREVALASRVTHPNVCRIHDLGEADGIRYISMEYVEGRSLRERLRREGRPEVATAVVLARQIAGALAAAHACGIVHRDLKPGNVMVDVDGRATVTDFGLAVAARPGVAERADFGGGTPHYMAPEQIVGGPIDARTDVYSLGCILYELLTGTRPFAGRQLEELLAAHRTEVPEPPSARTAGVPGWLEAIAMRCLQKDPARRYASAAEVAAALGAGPHGAAADGADRALGGLPGAELAADPAAARLGDVRAYECWLRAWDEIWRCVPEGLERALQHLRAAEALVGENVLLLAGMGFAWWQFVNAGVRTDPECLERAEACARRIFELAPDSAHGHRLLGLVALARGRPQEVIRRLKRALEADPADRDALLFLCATYGNVGRTAAAAPFAERLLQLDPLTPVNRFVPAWLHLMDGRAAEALAEYDRWRGMDPANPVPRISTGFCLAYLGRTEEACAAFAGVRRDFPGSFPARTAGYMEPALRGDGEAAREAVTAEVARVARGDAHFSWHLGEAFASIGDRDEALSWLENAFACGFYNHRLLGEHDVLLAGLRGEERLEALLERLRTAQAAIEV